ncbi:MAG: dephospho-CoA kinase [Actinomycetaceae bacterium]|nr:dephospho-CoA kinase [Actinomycetaceae bacterium]
MAITGGIASGKSTVCNMLLGRGVQSISEDAVQSSCKAGHDSATIDARRYHLDPPAPPRIALLSADRLGHELYHPGSGTVDKVIEAFGEDVSDGRGGINRQALARKAFSSSEKRKMLEEITHPLIRGCAQEFLSSGTTGQIRIYDVPLFVESGGIDVDCVIAVETPVELAVKRMMEKRNMSPRDAWRRISSQVSNQQRKAVSHLVIVNDTSLDDLRVCVEDELMPYLLHLLGCR